MKRILIFRKQFLIRFVRINICAAAGCILLFILAWICFPFPESRLQIREQSTVFTADNNEIIRVMLSPNDEYCIPVRLCDIASSAVQATIAVEDQRFRSHCGVDGTAVFRAVKQNVFSMKKESGASTITMQVIRMAYDRKRTLISKVFESFRALQLERICSKKEILETYLNSAPYGGNIYGIEAASLRYFNKRARDLNLAEASLLAGLPQSPSRFRPDRFPRRAYRRRLTVLRRMQEEGYISELQTQKAAQTEFKKLRHAFPLRAPHLTDALYTASRSGYVRTTVNLELQNMAEQVLRKHVAKLRPHRVSNGAVVIVDVRNSSVRAMVGSTDYWNIPHCGQINGVLSRRSAGSTLKPFLYTMAYETQRIIPRTTVYDVPVSFSGYEPEDYDKEFMGCISASESLALSRNIPAVKLLQDTGIQSFYHCLRKIGFSGIRKSSESYSLTLALGTCDVSLLELADAYACLARMGNYISSSMIAQSRRAAGIRIFSPQAVWLMYSSFTGPDRPLDGKCIVKTGTSWGYRDLWCVACDADFAVGVWLGNFDNSSCVKICGQDAAMPVVDELFSHLAKARGGYSVLPRPPGVGKITVCAKTGLRPTAACPCCTTAFALENGDQLPLCGIHRHVVRSLGSGLTQLAVKEEWPDSVVSWRSRTEMPEIQSRSDVRLRIQSPCDRAEFCMTSSAVPGAQKIGLAATGDARKRQYWFVNGTYLGSTSNGSSIVWPLSPGTHRISVTDKHATDSCRIFVR